MRCCDYALTRQLMVNFCVSAYLLHHALAVRWLSSGALCSLVRRVGTRSARAALRTWYVERWRACSATADAATSLQGGAQWKPCFVFVSESKPAPQTRGLIWYPFCYLPHVTNCWLRLCAAKKGTKYDPLFEVPAAYPGLRTVRVHVGAPAHKQMKPRLSL